MTDSEETGCSLLLAFSVCMFASEKAFTLSAVSLTANNVGLHCAELNRKTDRGKEMEWTYCPLEEWINRVMSVEVPGHTQFKASMAYLNSSSHTTWSADKRNERDKVTKVSTINKTIEPWIHSGLGKDSPVLGQCRQSEWINKGSIKPDIKKTLDSQESTACPQWQCKQCSCLCSAGIQVYHVHPVVSVR